MKKFIAMMLAFTVVSAVHAQDSSEGVEAKSKDGWVEAKSPWSFSYALDAEIGMNEVHKGTFNSYSQAHSFATSYKLDDKRKLMFLVPFVVTKSFDPKTGAFATGDTFKAGEAVELGGCTALPCVEAKKDKPTDPEKRLPLEQVPNKDFAMGNAYIRFSDSSLFSVGGSDVSGSVRLYMPTSALISEEARNTLPLQLRADFGWSSDIMSNLSFGAGLTPRIYRNLKGDNAGSPLASVYFETGLTQSFSDSAFSMGLTAYTNHAWKYKKAAASTQASTEPKDARDPAQDGIDQGSEDDEGTGPNQGEQVASTSTRDTSHDFGLFLSGSYKISDDVSMTLAIDHSTPWKDIKFATDNASYYLGMVVSL